jgi:hypothetical protein
MYPRFRVKLLDRSAEDSCLSPSADQPTALHDLAKENQQWGGSFGRREIRISPSCLQSQ